MLAGFLIDGKRSRLLAGSRLGRCLCVQQMGNENAAATAKILEKTAPLQEKRVQRSLLRIKDSKTFLEKLIPRSER